MGLKSSEGEIVQVQGGHIVRSTGRKDRHSKVYTSKGPRDRRVRLAAHTAIQFYDVQDRLGYDRPSKAVDWLINKAKSAIDKLAELPPWHPNVNAINNDNDAAMEADQDANVGSSEMGNIQEQSESTSGYGSFQIHNTNNDNSSFMAPPLDSDIADTLKSFFPTSATTSSINFQHYPADLISRSCTNPTHEDLGLSLHSFQGDQTSHAASTDHHHALFDGSSTVGSYHEANFQRMVAWNNETANTENRGGAGGGFLYNSPSLSTQQALAYSQRGPLQSSFTQSSSVHAWDDLTNQHHHHKTQEIDHHHSNSIFGSRFVSDGLQGFNIPARIHGQEHRDHNNRPSSSSSPNSHH
ncbi:hypothetical protein Ddye_004415 [Dipteronia dyeriana]|uniref:TCP domain-containing protein n=1 Tax=Dipteronia dyeriana TaxID=168575 RepID=A0AAD9XUR7_9ROSI|nr:hypothetical protein Ddye_004415 [Dipteronia dyeriana]